MKKVNCSHCGCTRRLMVKAKIRDQKAQVMFRTKLICLLCFLRFFKDSEETKTEIKFKTKELYETVVRDK